MKEHSLGALIGVVRHWNVLSRDFTPGTMSRPSRLPRPPQQVDQFQAEVRRRLSEVQLPHLCLPTGDAGQDEVVRWPMVRIISATSSRMVMPDFSSMVFRVHVSARRVSGARASAPGNAGLSDGCLLSTEHARGKMEPSPAQGELAFVHRVGLRINNMLLSCLDWQSPTMPAAGPGRFPTARWV
jgi:hypothetical protein